MLTYFELLVARAAEAKRFIVQHVWMMSVVTAAAYSTVVLVTKPVYFESQSVTGVTAAGRRVTVACDTRCHYR